MKACIWIVSFGVFLLSPCLAQETPEIHLAVEFVDHAACAHIARHYDWYAKAGLNLKAFDSFASGMALSAALCKGGIDAAYICLFPAINAHANGKVPIKIVAGTHLYGYGLIVNPEKIKTIEDLNTPHIRIGCTREGSPPAALLQQLVETHHLNAALISHARRMGPSKLLLSLLTGQIDAAFLPEQFPTMGEQTGFKELINAKALWPEMQGSVLVVRQELIQTHPHIVQKLVELTRRGIQYIKDHPEKSADIVAKALDVAQKQILPLGLTGMREKLKVRPETIQISLATKMENTINIDPKAVQSAIDFAARSGYIKDAFSAEEILDLRYLHE